MQEPTNYLAKAKQYWQHAPGGGGKVDTASLIQYSDSDFLNLWDEQKRLRRLVYWEEAEFIRYFAIRARNRDVFSFGCGLGYSEIDFLESGSRVTFADIVPTNLDCVNRLCALRGHSGNSTFLYMDDSAETDFGGPYDFVFAYGSLMHMPEPRQAAVLARMFKSLKPRGVVWLMLYTPRFVQSVGVSFDQTAFGKASDPSVGELDNPWSDWHDDEKLLRLAGPDACILNREEFNEGRYIWYGLGRRGEHNTTAVRPFIDLQEIEAARVDAEIKNGAIVAEVALNRGVISDASTAYSPETGLRIVTTENNFHYAAVFPSIAQAEGAPVPNRLIFDAVILNGGFSIGLLDTATNLFFYNCTIWRDGIVRGCRDLSQVEWPARYQVVISNYQPGQANSSEFYLRRIALYRSV